MSDEPILTPERRRFLEGSGRAVLATIDPRGRPRLVPVCFVVVRTAPVVFTPIDDKPKTTDDPRALGRVRDLLERPGVSLLVDRWDAADWERLAWLRLHGRASLVDPGEDGHAPAVAALRAKYPPYALHRLDERPLIRIDIEAASSWGQLGD